MANLAALKRKRGIIKGNLKRQENFCNNCDDSKDNEVEVRLSKINSYLEEFETIQFEIEELEGGVEDIEERETFSEQFFKVIGKFNELKKGSAPTSNSDMVQGGVGATVKKPEVKLPLWKFLLFMVRINIGWVFMTRFTHLSILILISRTLKNFTI